jgi:hypothetical protein
MNIHLMSWRARARGPSAAAHLLAQLGLHFGEPLSASSNRAKLVSSALAQITTICGVYVVEPLTISSTNAWPNPVELPEVSPSFPHRRL